MVVEIVESHWGLPICRANYRVRREILDWRNQTNQQWPGNSRYRYRPPSPCAVISRNSCIPAYQVPNCPKRVNASDSDRYLLYLFHSALQRKLHCLLVVARDSRSITVLYFLRIGGARGNHSGGESSVPRRVPLSTFQSFTLRIGTHCFRVVRGTLPLAATRKPSHCKI